MKDEKFDFPLYVGFGRLKRSEIKANDATVSAIYFFNDEPVHLVSFDILNQKWEIKDIFGEEGKRTVSESLDNAVMRHFDQVENGPSSLFRFVQDYICRVDNIYFENIPSSTENKNVNSLFPEGRLLIVRLPVFFDKEGKQKLELMLNHIPVIEPEGHQLFHLDEAYNTSILFSQKNGEKDVIPILMLEFFIPLAYIHEATKWLSENKLINAEKHFRLMVQDASTKANNFIQSFTYTTHDLYSEYHMILKGLDCDAASFEKFEKQIISKQNWDGYKFIFK